MPSFLHFITFQDPSLEGASLCEQYQRNPKLEYNPLSPALSEHPIATVQTEFLTKLPAKSSHNKFTPSIPEQRCSHTPPPAPHAFGTATNLVTTNRTRSSMKIRRVDILHLLSSLTKLSLNRAAPFYPTTHPRLMSGLCSLFAQLLAQISEELQYFFRAESPANITNTTLRMDLRS